LLIVGSAGCSRARVAGSTTRSCDRAAHGEARLPRKKTLDEFDFVRNPKVSAQQIHQLASGDYIAKASDRSRLGERPTDTEQAPCNGGAELQIGRSNARCMTFGLPFVRVRPVLKLKLNATPSSASIVPIHLPDGVVCFGFY
jgi:hypothetical protein